MLWVNIQRRLVAVGIQVEHAETGGISNTAKSSYYRSAIILSCTVVEGMVYELVKKSTTHIGNIVGSSFEHKERSKFPKAAFGITQDIIFCEKVRKDTHIDDSGVDFGKLNIYLKNNRIVSDKEFALLNWIRLERNKIHLQGLSTPDTNYTKAKVEKIGKAIVLLVSKLEALP